MMIFWTPLRFRPTSTLGCAGLLDAYRAGHVTICNAVGTGVADDKSIYPYVPKMIEFYLGEKPILNNVPTYMCRNKDDLAYTLANLKDLVVKEVHGAGGYGMLVGPASTKAEIEDFRKAVLANPSGYIAQPTLSLSSCPTFVESGIAPRHIDLRPYVLSGKTVQMVPGGLTRVALKDGSLVVNSSQGGGTKDTWILEDEALALQRLQQHPLHALSQTDSEGARHAVTHRRPPFLDVPLHRAGREHRAHARRELPDLAAAPIRGRGPGGLAGLAVHQRVAAHLHQAQHGDVRPAT
jgi:uncharacterized circularly permuted ATP-grasp superfamily protein